MCSFGLVDKQRYRLENSYNIFYFVCVKTHTHKNKIRINNISVKITPIHYLIKFYWIFVVIVVYFEGKKKNSPLKWNEKSKHKYNNYWANHGNWDVWNFWSLSLSLSIALFNSLLDFLCLRYVKKKKKFLFCF